MVLELREASPDQLDTLWTANFVSWGTPLSLQAYLTRERLLIQTPLLANGGITFWILVNTPSPTPLCACETFNRKKGLVKIPGNQVREVAVIGVASVFTPAENRGKGYAGIMLKLLSDRIRGMIGDQGFSVLYSDIGPEFYAKNGGWKTYDANELVIPHTKEYTVIIPVELLNLTEAAEWIDKDVSLIKKEFEEVDCTTIRMIPLHGELGWANLRGIQAAEHLRLEKPRNVGAVVSSAEGWGYLLWFHEYKESSLTVLRLREPPSDSALRGLLEVAVAEANRSQLKKVKFWSPSERLEQISGIEKVARASSLPALLYAGEEGKVKWLNIEKLGWC